jgi:hypothetical protein
MRTQAAWTLAVPLLLSGGLAAGQDTAGFRKAYFGATAVGAWAKYRMTSPGAQEGFTTYTRLADEEGQQRLRVRVEFTAEGRRNTANNEYTLEKGFSLEKDALGFGRAVESAVTWQGSDEPEELPDEAVEDLQAMAPDFGERARFVAAEIVSGRKCDRYRYTQKHPGDPATFEAGEIWLDPTVPFGVVRQTGELTDSRGRFISSYAMLLMDSGTGPAPPPRTRRAAATTPVKLAEAYGDGQVEIQADAAGSNGLKAAFKNISQESIRLTIPSGPTALEVGAPVGTLRLESASTWLFDLGPGETSETVELGQSGAPRVASGRFSAHRRDGKPVFTGNAALDTAK